MADHRKKKHKQVSSNEDRILPAYEYPPPWIPSQQRWNHPNYNSNLIAFLPRTVILERHEDRPLGFNVRGGPANEYGVYVSKVLPGSEAEKLGLKRGDKILHVNDVDFLDIPHSKAVGMLQECDHLELRVQHFPFGFSLQQDRIGMI